MLLATLFSGHENHEAWARVRGRARKSYAFSNLRPLRSPASEWLSAVTIRVCWSALIEEFSVGFVLMHRMAGRQRRGQHKGVRLGADYLCIGITRGFN
jgi:hypothetical protein